MTPNQEQQSAINSTAAQIICIAGAGSGKSSTLVARIHRIIKDGTDPASIVAITFTTAAANVLHQRLGIRLGYIGTLHSFMLRLLEKYGDRIGLPKNLTVLDDDGRQRLIDSIVRDLKVRDSQERIQEAMADERYAQAQPRGALLNKTALAAVEYHRRCREAGLIDFAGILREGLRLVKAMPAQEWPYAALFWDEAQDSSDTDWEIMLAMPCQTKFLCADPDQGIFAFRQGNVRNVVNLALNAEG